MQKTCIFCTGVVGLALPVAIVLNYHLALIATLYASAKGHVIFNHSYI